MTKTPNNPENPTLKLVDGKEPQLNAAGPTPKPSDINPFRLEHLVIRPAYKDAPDLVTSMATIPVLDKAGDQTFFMVHPNPEYAQVLLVIKFDADREWYVVSPAVASALSDEKSIRMAKIYPCRSMTGKEFLVVAPMPRDTDSSLWLSSKHECMEAARSRFIRMRSNQEAGQWVQQYAKNAMPEVPPDWGIESYESILLRGFKTPRQDRYVDTMDHPVVKSLEGIPLC